MFIYPNLVEHSLRFVKRASLSSRGRTLLLGVAKLVDARGLVRAAVLMATIARMHDTALWLATFIAACECMNAMCLEKQYILLVCRKMLVVFPEENRMFRSNILLEHHRDITSKVGGSPTPDSKQHFRCSRPKDQSNFLPFSGDVIHTKAENQPPLSTGYVGTAAPLRSQNSFQPEFVTIFHSVFCEGVSCDWAVIAWLHFVYSNRACIIQHPTPPELFVAHYYYYRS